MNIITQQYIKIPKPDDVKILDKSLSWGAICLLYYMRSMSHTWNFNPQHLSGLTKSKRTATRHILQELINAGHVIKNRITDNKGRVVDWKWELKERATFRNAECGQNPDSGSERY